MWAPILLLLVVVVVVAESFLLLRVVGVLRVMARQLASLACIEQTRDEVDRLIKRVIGES